MDAERLDLAQNKLKPARHQRCHCTATVPSWRLKISAIHERRLACLSRVGVHRHKFDDGLGFFNRCGHYKKRSMSFNRQPTEINEVKTRNPYELLSNMQDLKLGTNNHNGLKCFFNFFFIFNFMNLCN